jgi:hypothetical protein
MDGRVPRPGGRPVKRGIVFEHTPEELAFQRWNKGEFLDVEKVAASGWRKALSELDLKKIASELEMLGIKAAGRLLGVVYAVDEENARATAIVQFDIRNPDKTRLLVRRATG